MNSKEGLKDLLKKVKNNEISIDDAVVKLKMKPFSDIGYAKIDNHRSIRQGVSEVIYGEKKTAKQILGIVNGMRDNGSENILITRIDENKYKKLKDSIDIVYYDKAKMGIAYENKDIDKVGKIVIAAAGTSDIDVCEEAYITASTLGSNVERLYDVGVAGLHRLLNNLDVLMSARVIIVVAGMEGALASVVGGLVDCPVIAVPTSVGYGANFGGLSALLSMLNSCASGVSVVNIDNGFGAGYLANMINKMEGIDE
ncbi:nickel pincer cofactor biosynthesis protein LarB [Anaerofustis stercorihominis]|uniref:nickel pincer cofactor biosynthesis protein LarB n=1 Tax=Anaerofustis stercorihominis TaxID=214853 RepID=UPI00214CD1C1|nr:nickel pincer cofactor biosynthesis protein LarB [Anaerofustis stercorihominis]MCR2032202.1 nickel pincer cofactor biosynthesis protein LarB [Anaerofustis stercorihominis]